MCNTKETVYMAQVLNICSVGHGKSRFIRPLLLQWKEYTRGNEMQGLK
jgi:hypothetical protein